MLPLVAKYLIRKRLASRNALSQRLHGNLIKSVAVVGSANEPNFNRTRSYVKELRERGIMKVDFFVFVPNQTALDSFQATSGDFPFCPKAISFFGSFNSPELNRVSSTEYEIVVDLTGGTNVYADLVMTSINSKLRAGFLSKNRTRFYDFMIDAHKLEFNDALAHLDSYLFKLNHQYDHHE